MNYQSWVGCGDPKLGYGSMLDGFRSVAPKSVVFDERASVQVHMQTPDAWKGAYAGQHKVLFTMWETDEMPARFRPWLGLFDQVLVPCRHNAELFGQFHSDVTAVPLGVDTKFWCPQPRPNGPFRFVAGGSLWRRKGLDLVVEAFRKAKLRDAELHIKAAPHAFDTPRVTGDHITLYRKWMPLVETRAWYAQGDCFVAPARGEGFGLMPLQAIAMGIPTILSNSSGQAEFAHLATGMVTCGKSRAETCGRWDEPHLDELVDQMRYHYANRDQLREQAELTVPKVTEFSWAKSTKKLLAAIPTGTRLDDPTWETPQPVITVRATRKVDANIAGRRYRFHAGETVTLPDNAYQVLFQSGAVETA